MTTVRPPIGPVRVVADTGDTDEQVDIAQDFRKHQRRNHFQGQRLIVAFSAPAGAISASASVSPQLRGINRIETNLIGGQAMINSAFIRVSAVIFADSLYPKLSSQIPLGKQPERRR